MYQKLKHGRSGDESPVPVVNQIRTYWWCSPPRTGRQRMVPGSWTARETGASSSKDKCVLRCDISCTTAVHDGGVARRTQQRGQGSGSPWIASRCHPVAPGPVAEIRITFLLRLHCARQIPHVSSRGSMPTFWKRDERPAQSIVVGGDNRLVTGHGVSLLIFWVGTNRLDISRYFKIVLHSQAPVGSTR